MANLQGNQKQKRYNVPANNVLESLRDISGGVSHAVANDVVSKISADAINSIFGKPIGGDLHPNESISIPNKAETQPEQKVRHTPSEMHSPLRRSDETYVRQQLEAIRSELKMLAKSVKSLHSEVKNAVATDPVDPGVYHLNFYDQLLQFIKTIRMQVEDSRTWLSVSKQRRSKKVGYWGMYKKHGTTFGLSSERTLATQAG